ncbi:MAG: type II secretion system ATPase GspE [bacterium]
MKKGKRIGDILLKENYIKIEELEKGLKIQKEKEENKKLGNVLINMGLVDEKNILKALSIQFDLTFQDKIKINKDSIPQDIISNIPFAFSKRYLVVPIEFKNNQLTIATADPLNLHPLDDIRLLTNFEIKPVVSTQEEITKAINLLYQQKPDSAIKMIHDMDTSDGNLLDKKLEEKVTGEDKDLLDSANEAPIIKLVNLILAQAIKDRASDIHLEPFEKELRVRIRIDGILYTIVTPPLKYHAAIVSRIKIMANLNIAERRLPHDGRIAIKIGNRLIDIRVSIVPTAFGERVVMRLLDKTNFLFNLEELGMPQSVLQKFERAIRSTHGIILVTGPTGSGKTTTLYASLNKINSTEKNIITVEDPIEYQLNGICQIQVKPKINLNFANGLRSILRQDPDIIMVGEIRDYETADISIQASLTGHLVFSTLHTNDSSGAITRLMDMGIEPYLLASSINAVVAQRLVRCICDNCKKIYVPTKDSLTEVGIDISLLNDNILWKGQGCKECLQTGYKGRIGIYELLPLDDEIRKMVIKRCDANEIKKKGIELGMVTLRQNGIQKVISGITTIDEILRVTQEDGN